MKKFLLSLALTATTLSMSAEKVVFIADGSLDFYSGDAKKEVILTGQQGSENLPITGAFGQISFSNMQCKVGAFRIYRSSCKMTIAPVAGITINKVTIRQQNDTKFNGLVPGATFDAASQCQVLENITEPTTYDMTTCSADLRASWIEVDYSGTPTTQVAPALFNSTFPMVAAGSTVKLASATAGAKIEYNLEGAEGTWVAYPEAGIPVTADCIIYARATKDGMTASPIAAASFSPIAAGLTMAEFAFNTWPNMPTYTDGTKPSMDDLATDGNEGNKSIVVSTKTFTSNNVTLNIAKGSTDTKLYYSNTLGFTIDLRYYTKSIHTITAPAGKVLSNVLFVGGELDNFNVPDQEQCKSSITEGKGTIARRQGNVNQYLWTAPETAPSTLKLTMGQTWQSTKFANYTGYLAHVYVFYKEPGSSSVTELGNDNAPVEYFNLQGVRVNEPTNGLYIRRQGNTVTKVMIQK